MLSAFKKLLLWKHGEEKFHFPEVYTMNYGTFPLYLSDDPNEQFHLLRYYVVLASQCTTQDKTKPLYKMYVNYSHQCAVALEENASKPDSKNIPPGRTVNEYIDQAKKYYAELYPSKINTPANH